ncbi:hypothetical protein YC2023_002619 [Brassica napus]
MFDLIICRAKYKAPNGMVITFERCGTSGSTAVSLYVKLENRPVSLPTIIKSYRGQDLVGQLRLVSDFTTKKKAHLKHWKYPKWRNIQRMLVLRFS